MSELKIVFDICSIKESTDVLEKLLISDFCIAPRIAKKLINEKYKPFIDKLDDNLWIFIEHPYVDKVYRDSYYNYFSTKPNHSKKDCIRVSIFNSEISYNSFRRKTNIEELKNKFLGFLVIRPTPPQIIGRNVISPKAFKENLFKCCLVDVEVTVNSVKMIVTGFPHSSQDTETITCAETTLWSCMEYFGFKYPEYKPILPSHIINTLSKVSFERQLPSNGLNVLQISSALKEFSFGTKIYSAAEYGRIFPSIFSTYVESGVPVVVILQKPSSYGHAVICIGRKNIEKENIEKYLTTISLDNGIKIYDLDGLEKNFILIDDNYPPYMSAIFNEPCKYYANPDFHHFKIKYFVVPLYSKIYLEAFQAKNFVCSLLSQSPYRLKNNSFATLRFYLTSTRSFKDWLAIKSDMQEDLAEIILSTVMPKFIWVAEIGTKETFAKNQANGIILLDATSANTQELKPLIICAHSNMLITSDINNQETEPLPIHLREFSIFENLKN